MKNVILVFVAVAVIAGAVVAYMLVGGDKPESSPGVSGAVGGGKGRVVLYVAHDKNFSEKLCAEFEKETGIKVEARYDTEADKTVGHVNRLLAERNNPKCDVHWNNEPMHTVRLAREGIYESYKSKIVDKFPKTFVDSQYRWIGFAARARVLVVNTSLKYPFEIKGLQDLTRPELKGKFCVANPRAGSTQTHMAALYSVWGPEKFTEWIKAIKANDVKILNSNGRTCDAVANGELLTGLTDTDDVIDRREGEGKPVEPVFCDMDGQGTLLFPNTLAIVKGGPNPENARILYEWALMKELDMCMSTSAQIPLNKDVKAPEGRYSISDIKALDVDWQKVADVQEEVMKILEQYLIP
ncbi:MAG: extracellular solute-binding protein [Planctomycetota bacterium]